MPTEIILEALAAYGAELDAQGYIVRNGRSLPVRVAVERKRLRFIGANGATLATGAVSSTTVSGFVEKFWFWQRSK